MFLALLTGCIIVTGEDKPAEGYGVEPGCDMMAVGSVNVTVTDAQGRPLRQASVEWRREDRDYRACEAMPEPGVWVCGWEEAGDLTVRVSAEGYQALEQVVHVPRGECHVEPQSLAVVLEPETACTEELRTSVVVSLAGSEGEVLEGPEVWWELPGAGAPAQPCDRGEEAWSCGYEVSGTLRVTGTAAGHTSSTVDVEVGADECHVLTEYVSLVVEWLPD